MNGSECLGVGIFDMLFDHLGEFGLTEPGEQGLLRWRQAGFSRANPARQARELPPPQALHRRDISLTISVTPPQSAESLGVGLSKSVTAADNVTDAKSTKLAESLTCDGVTDGAPPIADRPPSEAGHALRWQQARRCRAR
jgi:hypothetical protein